MKILFLIECLRAGGKERRLSSLFNYFLSNPNVSIELILFDEEIHYDIPKSKNFKIHILKRRFKKDFFLIYDIYKICKNFKPDLINPWGIMPAFYAVFMKYFFKIPLVNSQITDAPENVKFGIHTITLFFSDLIISNSKAGLLSYNISKQKNLVIYNGFDFKRLDYLEDPFIVRKKYNLYNDLIIGMVASFSSLKDYTTYLKSAELVLSKYNNIKFLCIGDGDKSIYQEKININFSDRIIFIDKIKDIESLINIFDIGVLSTYSEGISNSIMEYMALSKPVVATEGGGTSELVNSKSGYLVRQKAPMELANKLEILIKSNEKRHAMGKRGREIIENKFNFNKMCMSFHDTFKNILH
tara:strand:- start:138 stop:1205 length:1068 start_codon:yes stop_codon:yes gene_type:complete